MSATGVSLQNNYINLNVELGLNGAAQAKKANDKNSKVEEKQNKNPDLEFEKAPDSEVKEKKKEQEEVKRLKDRDREVKIHEQAHKRTAGSLSSGPPNYEYTIGPDGQRYASGGDVSIDVSPVPDDPEATIRKARQIKQAALAPQRPSSQDRKVAQEAAQMERNAQVELQKKKLSDSKDSIESLKTGEKPLDKFESKNEITTYDSSGRIENHKMTPTKLDVKVK
ncbi:MAG: hypothetical protein JEY94_12805 [Melioribacteraceae bacterium]|nr:hypothetical protein [Melioribacteraceae bacterium]